MDFTPLKPTAEMIQKQTRPHLGFRQDAWLRLKKKVLGRILSLLKRLWETLRRLWS